MIYIKKGPPHRNVSTKAAAIRRDPSWKKIPLTKPTDSKLAKGYGETLRNYFEQLPKTEIRETLLEEQHYLCAYCMRELSDVDAVTIEHWFPLSQARDTAIDYQNFLGSCSGIYSQGQQPCRCCDNSKGGTPIKINPCQQWMMDCIHYESDGTIYFVAPDNLEPDTKKELNDDVYRDINETLCLNGAESELTLHRARILRSCRKELKLLHASNKCSIATVTRLVQRIENKQRYPAYAGVMLSVYKRWLKNHT